MFWSCRISQVISESLPEILHEILQENPRMGQPNKTRNFSFGGSPKKKKNTCKNHITFAGAWGDPPGKEKNLALEST
jgi:hypothetical protein